MDPVAERESIHRLVRNGIKLLVFAEIIEITERPQLAHPEKRNNDREITWLRCMLVSPSARKAERE